MVESNDELREILSQARTIAVVGMKANQSEDAFRIPLYMQSHGYRVVPVNPKLAEVLGERAYDTLSDIPGELAVDLVDLFRASDHIPGHTEEILRMSPRPRAVWMQLGIAHGPAAAKLRAAGVAVIQDRCIMVEHRRLGIGTETSAAIDAEVGAESA